MARCSASPGADPPHPAPGQPLRALALLAGLVPATALAAPIPDSCSASRAVPFSIPVPADMRISGVHRFEWYSTWTNPDGSVAGRGTSRNQILIDAAAPVYPNTVLLRIFRNTTLLADGSVVDVDAIRLVRAAELYSRLLGHGRRRVPASFRLWLRYGTSNEPLGADYRPRAWGGRASATR